MRLFQEVLSAVEGPSVHGAGSEGGRGSLPSSTQQHLLHLPQLAQLAHLGNLNMVQVIPPQPPPPHHPADNRKHTGSVPQSTSRSRPRPRRVQCPLCWRPPHPFLHLLSLYQLLFAPIQMLKGLKTCPRRLPTVQSWARRVYLHFSPLTETTTTNGRLSFCW